MESIETSKTDPIVSPWARWLMPCIADVVFVCFFLTALSFGNKLLADADTAWHIRTGDYIISRLEVPRTDIFSYRKYGEPWIAHEWLSDVIFSLLHRFAGLNGIVVFSALIIAVTFFLLFKMLETYRFNILVIALVTLLSGVTASLHWLARPHLFSTCLALLWYFLLESHQRSPRRTSLFLFPVLMSLWVNLHGGYLLGFVLLGLYWAGNIMTYLAAVGRGQQPGQNPIGSLAVIAVLSFLATFLNPYGYQAVLFPFEILGSTAQMENISEWHSPSFHKFSYYEVYLILLVVTFLASSKKATLIEVGITLFSIHISLFAQRYVPIFAILMAPVLGQRLDDLYRTVVNCPSSFSVIRGLQKRALESIKNVEFLNNHFNRHIHPFMLSLVMLILVLNGGGVFGTTFLDYKFHGENYPIRAVEFLRQNSLSGNMYNSYVFGGYLIYSFFPDPRYRVFVDGRAFVGGDDYLTESLKVSFLTPEWRETLEKNKVNWIIEGSRSAFSVFLSAHHDWKLVYSDEVASIFVKNVPQNRPIMDRYPDVKPFLRTPDSMSILKKTTLWQ